MEMTEEVRHASFPRAGIATVCSACGERVQFECFEIARQIGGLNVDILICPSCMVLVNRGAYDRFELTPESKLVQKTDFYSGSRNSSEHERAQVEATDGIIRYLFTKAARDWPDLTFCDFGAGRGYAAFAAAQYFKRSVACEFDIRNILDVCAKLERPANLQIKTDIFDVDGCIDVLFAWHVLEHIPDLHDLFKRLAPKLRKGSLIFFQCPCFRPDYIVDCHYLFFNRVSVGRVLNRAGFKEIDVGFDVENGFITYVGEFVGA